MDSQRFDAMTRELASTTSRRGLLKGAVGGSLGGALAVAGLSRGAAASTCGPSPTDAIVYQIIAIIAQVLRSVGIPIPVPTPPEPITCPEGTALNPDTCECDCALTDNACPGQSTLAMDTCECYCPLTVSDCPGGVDQETCSCIEIICSELNADCGAEGLECSCGHDIETDELLCVDHNGRSGIENECDEHSDCPGNMVCAEDTGSCLGGYCYPPCGQVEEYMLHFGPYQQV